MDSMARLVDDLHTFNLLCKSKINSEEIRLLDEMEINMLFKARDMSEMLGSIILELYGIFYQNKIMI